MRNTKKVLALLLATLMLISLAGCSKPDDPVPGTADPAETTKQTTAPAQTDPDPTQPADTDEGYASKEFTQFGNAKITILGAEFIKDDYDDDVLRIYYDYTNTGTSACGQDPSSLWFKSITQDGKECIKTQFGTNDDCAIPEDLNYDCPVQPGLTSRQTMLIECDPNGGAVEISCYLMIGSWVYEEDTVEYFTFQIDPKNLPAVPAPFEMAPIMNPTYAAGLPTSGTNDNGQISIDGMELTVGDEGENVLRVKLTVTNNSEDATSPMNITNGVEVYQDGLALPWFSTWDLEATAEDEAYEEDLEPGETIQCSALFQLRNDHPVEIVVESLYDDLRLGMIGDIKAAMEAIQAAVDAQQQAADAAAAAARKALVGTWLQRDSDWEDTYIFNADGTGLLISGPEYPFTYSVSGETLTLTYDPEDVEEFTITVDGNLLTMINTWDEELLLDKQTEGAPEPSTEQTDPAEVTKPAEPTLKELIIGTWEDQETEYKETFTFNADGTGKYGFEDGGYWEYTFTYAWYDGDYVEFTYDDDGSTGGFTVRIEGDVMYVSNAAVVDMPLVRK